VPQRWTTRCCSALALATLLALAGRSDAAGKSDNEPLPFWPVRPLWTLALNRAVTASPAFDATHGYFPLAGGQLVAYELAGGARTWIVDAAPSSAPTAGGGLVFFVEDGALVALDAKSGSRTWTVWLDDDLVVPPVWTSGWLMLATTSGTVAAVRADDGHEIWRRDLGVAAHARPAVSGDRVYVPLGDHRVVALQIESGAPLWERRLGGTPNDILALDERLFVGAGDNYFYCLTTDDGRVDWRWHAGADAIGMPAVDARHVFFVSLDNVVRSLNRSNGVQQWIQLLKLRPTGGPLRAGGTVIVYGLQPPLRAINAADGKGGGDIAAAGPLAVAPQLIAADEPTPLLVVITRDVAKGDTVTLLSRTVEPPASALAPLPNALTSVPRLPGQP